jgi:hypothetical protein
MLAKKMLTIFSKNVGAILLKNVKNLLIQHFLKDVGTIFTKNCVENVDELLIQHFLKSCLPNIY